jgi:hypothetical protein
MGVNPRFVKLVAAGVLVAAVIVLVNVVAQIQTGSAQGQPASDRINALEQRLGQASQQEMKTGQLTDTPHGQYFTGDSATKMEDMHQKTQQEIDAIIARPESERQGAIDAIRAFAKDPGVQVVYQQTLKMPYDGGAAQVEVYYVGLDQYVVLPEGNKIVQVGERPRLPGEAGRQYDMTPRYDREQLEKIAIAFITERAPEVDLSKLTPRFGSKGAVAANDKNGVHYAGTPQDTNYFFRWEDDTPNSTGDARDVPFIQVGFSIGGTFLSYTNTLTP